MRTAVESTVIAILATLGAMFIISCAPGTPTIYWTTQEAGFYASALGQGTDDGQMYTYGGTHFPWAESDTLYKLNGESLDPVAKTGFKRAYVKTFALDGSMYVVSGRENMKATGTLLKIDLKTYEVTQLASMNTPRLCFALGHFDDGRIIVGGGFNPNDAGGFFMNHDTMLSSLEQYDPITNTWDILPIGMPQGAVSHVEGFVFQDKFHVVAGMSLNQDSADPGGGNPLSRTYHTGIWRLDGNSWTQVATLPVGIAGMGVAVWRHYLIIVGGQYAVTPYDMKSPIDGKDFKIVYAYSDRQFVVDLNNWEAVELEEKMPMAANDVGLTVVGDSLYTVGGETFDFHHNNKINLLRIGSISLEQ